MTQYYKNITSFDRRKCENTKRYTSMNSTKGAYESQKKNSRGEQGGRKERTQDGLPMIHAFTAHRWSATGRSIISKLHDLDMQI